MESEPNCSQANGKIYFILRIALFVEVQIYLLGEVYRSLLFSKCFCFLTVPLPGQQSEQKRNWMQSL